MPKPLIAETPNTPNGRNTLIILVEESLEIFHR